MIRKIKGKWVALAALGVAVTSTALAVPPTTMEEVAELSTSYIGKAQVAAIAAAAVSFGWVLFRVVKKYTGRA